MRITEQALEKVGVAIIDGNAGWYRCMKCGQEWIHQARFNSYSIGLWRWGSLVITVNRYAREWWQCPNVVMHFTRLPLYQPQPDNLSGQS